MNFVFINFVFWLRVVLSSSSSIPCDRDLSTEITKIKIYRNNNSLLSDDGIIYPANLYWFENNKTFGCTCDVRNNCLRKCCPFGYAKRDSFERSKCEKWNETINFNPPVHENVINKKIVNYPNFTIIHGETCEQYFRLEPHLSEDDEYFLSPNGSLYYGNRTFTFNEYCFEYYQDVENILPTICYTPELAMWSENHPVFYIVLLLLSLPFFVTIILVYTLVTELRNQHGKCLICHVSCLLCAYFVLGISQFDWNVSDSLCLIYAYIMQFSFLASFFWLNVMCFDLWWTFSGYRSFHGSAKEKERKKFFVYSLYAWGCPLIISLITLAVEYWSVIPKSIIRPGFGVSSCWFDKATKWSVFIYFYLPISIILIANTCMFISTSLIIIKHAKETKVFKRQGSKRHNENEKQRFYVYLKLFIVMGVNWIMEVISWLVGGPDYLWYITDVGNTLQGVLIFFIFVCKKRILRLLNRKICPKYEWFPMKRGSGSTTGTTVASISDTKDSRIRMDSVDLGTNSTPDVHM